MRTTINAARPEAVRTDTARTDRVRLGQVCWHCGKLIVAAYDARYALGDATVYYSWSCDACGEDFATTESTPPIHIRDIETDWSGCRDAALCEPA